MKLEWDEKKNKENIRKHGFDFADAWEVFDLPLLTSADTRQTYGENRLIGIGFSSSGLSLLSSRNETMIQFALFRYERR